MDQWQEGTNVQAAKESVWVAEDVPKISEV
jgi:hypothetical protein